MVLCGEGMLILEKTSSSQLEPRTSHASPVSSEDNSDSVNDATFQSSTTDIAATNSQPEPTSSDPVTETDSSTETVEASTSRYPKRATKPPD